MTKGRSLRLFLADGTPGGIITAEIMNWTGHVITAPRSRLADLVRRDEAGRTGVYFLSGTDLEGGALPLLYIGESDAVGERLKQHNADERKDFWEQTCFVTSKDQNLTKAHVRYLESRLIAIARQSGRARLVNSTTPPDFGRLPESDIADMEFFLEQIRILLPVLGMEFLRDVSSAPVLMQPQDRMAPTDGTMFELNSKKYHAEAQDIDGDFVVLKGAEANPDWISNHPSYKNLHQQLKDSHILAPAPDGRTLFQQDYSFNSPSAACSVVLGRPDNGHRIWRVKGTGKTYAEWQSGQMKNDSSGSNTP